MKQVYEVQESRHTKGEWVVEMIDHGSEGEVYVTIFSGPQARERAEEYAAWKNRATFRHGRPVISPAMAREMDCPFPPYEA